MPAAEKVANTGVLGLPAYLASKLGRAIKDTFFPEKPKQYRLKIRCLAEGFNVEGFSSRRRRGCRVFTPPSAPKEQFNRRDLINIINERAASGDTDTKTTLANLVRNAKAAGSSRINASYDGWNSKETKHQQ